MYGLVYKTMIRPGKASITRSGRKGRRQWSHQTDGNVQGFAQPEPSSCFQVRLYHNLDFATFDYPRPFDDVFYVLQLWKPENNRYFWKSWTPLSRMVFRILREFYLSKLGVCFRFQRIQHTFTDVKNLCIPRLGGFLMEAVRPSSLESLLGHLHPWHAKESNKSDGGVLSTCSTRCITFASCYFFFVPRICYAWL